MVKNPNDENVTRAFQHLLCEERKKRNLSQFELAKRSGLTRQCVSLFESDRRAPTLHSMLHLARGFDIPLHRFFSKLTNKADYYESCDNLSIAADQDSSPKWKV